MRLDSHGAGSSQQLVAFLDCGDEGRRAAMLIAGHKAAGRWAYDMQHLAKKNQKAMLSMLNEVDGG